MQPVSDPKENSEYQKAEPELYGQGDVEQRDHAHLEAKPTE